MTICKTAVVLITTGGLLAAKRRVVTNFIYPMLTIVRKFFWLKVDK